MAHWVSFICEEAVLKLANWLRGGRFPIRCRGDTRRRWRRPVARHDWPRLDAGEIVRPQRRRRRGLGHQGERLSRRRAEPIFAGDRPPDGGCRPYIALVSRLRRFSDGYLSPQSHSRHAGAAPPPKVSRSPHNMAKIKTENFEKPRNSTTFAPRKAAMPRHSGFSQSWSDARAVEEARLESV